MIGLAIGLASFILIVLYVYDEFSYDKYHKNSDRIYRITSKLDFEGVGEESASQPFPLGPAFVKDYPEIVEASVRFYNMQRTQFQISANQKTFNEKRFFYCDSNVFEVFDFHLLSGNKENALVKPFSIIITESTAKKYFETLEVIGKTITIDGHLEFEITGIIEDVKSQSHFKFDFLASFSSLDYLFKNSNMMEGWISNPCWTYLLLHNGLERSQLDAILPEFVDTHFSSDEKDNFKLFSQPLVDIHLNSNLDYEIEKNENLLYIKLLLAIAFLILLIASINFINLTTASAANRAKEIGIKKAIGATKRQLISQFLTESMLTTFISLLIAISLVELFLPAFSLITDKIVTIDFRFKKETILGLISLGVFTGLISGLYPALFLSSFKSVRLLRTGFKLSTKSTNFRKVLVLIQFSVSLVLIIGTLGVFKQIKYLHTADLGFKKNSMVVIDTNYEEARKYDKIKKELLKDTLVKHVTGMNYILGSSHNTYQFIPEGRDFSGYQFYPAMYVRGDFVKAFGIKILAGRDFLPNEEDAGKALLVNEEMVKYFNYEKNEDILGMKFKTSQGYEPVVGVFSNINATPLHSKVEPFFIKSTNHPKKRISDTRYIVIKIEDEKVDESLLWIKNVWEKLEIEKPFEYQFLDDIINSHYSGEEVLGDLARIFTILSIIIAALGIWGLSAYITERRTREIGIRKALGATILNIVKLVNKEFFGIMIIANLIAWPIAFLILDNWISSFAYRDYIGILSYALASILGSLIAVLTISHKAIEAGNKNPVEALRYE